MNTRRWDEARGSGQPTRVHRPSTIGGTHEGIIGVHTGRYNRGIQGIMMANKAENRGRGPGG